MPDIALHGLHQTSVAIQRSEEERTIFMAEISMYNPDMIIWLDETGCD